MQRLGGVRYWHFYWQNFNIWYYYTGAWKSASQWNDFIPSDVPAWLGPKAPALAFSRPGPGQSPPLMAWPWPGLAQAVAFGIQYHIRQWETIVGGEGCAAWQHHHWVPSGQILHQNDTLKGEGLPEQENTTRTDTETSRIWISAI